MTNQGSKSEVSTAAEGTHGPVVDVRWCKGCPLRTSLLRAAVLVQAPPIARPLSTSLRGWLAM